MSFSESFSGNLPSNYEEVLYWRITERTSRILLMNALSIPLALVFAFGFLNFVQSFGQPPPIISFDLTQTALLLLGVPLVFILHELAHGIAMRLFGAQPQYSIFWKGLMFYATSPGYAFPRNQYLVVSLAPLVSLSIVACLGILIQAGTLLFGCGPCGQLSTVVERLAIYGSLFLCFVIPKTPISLTNEMVSGFSCRKVQAVPSERLIMNAPNNACRRTWWWAVQKSRVQAKAFSRFVGCLSHQAANASR
jgi:hypothetical protein